MDIQPPRFLSGELLGFLAFSRTSISGDDHNELKKATTSKDEEDCLLPYDRSLKFRVNRIHWIWFCFMGRIALEGMHSD